ncbi:hypothetical protein F5Y10DRAFT_264779 [Nemania abortiva]|nr:hypothetical protein F5Y10DRAFT_264779 [Nemania abortiva]
MAGKLTRAASTAYYIHMPQPRWHSNKTSYVVGRSIRFIPTDCDPFIQALKTSQSASGAEERLKTILQSTRGIIFYATPHAGSGLANWGELLTRIGGVFSVTNTKLLAALNAQNDSGQLEELRRDFNRMLGPQLRVVNFRETRPMSLGLRLTTRFVVPLASAEIVNEWADNRTLDADHQGVCKFGGPDDVGYGDLKAVLERYLNEFASQPVVGVAKAIGDGGS